MIAQYVCQLSLRLSEFFVVLCSSQRRPMGQICSWELFLGRITQAHTSSQFQRFIDRPLDPLRVAGSCNLEPLAPVCGTERRAVVRVLRRIWLRQPPRAVPRLTMELLSCNVWFLTDASLHHCAASSWLPAFLLLSRVHLCRGGWAVSRLNPVCLAGFHHRRVLFDRVGWGRTHVRLLSAGWSSVLMVLF